MSTCCLKESAVLNNLTAVRYYAEWLDGEYVLLNQMIGRYDHSAVTLVRRGTDSRRRRPVNRTKFHEQRKMNIEAYIAALQDPKNSKLRVKFRKKMKLICRS
jgi:hypothetical protein